MSGKKTILITGAGTGIGKDAAKALIARGHTVHATTHHDGEVATLQAELGPAAKVFKLDITVAEDRAKIAGLGIDVLVNNAAQGQSGSLAEIDIDRVRRLFEVNLFSGLELTQIAIRDMIAQGGGTVIFVSSIAGRIPTPFAMPYSMTKFAISAAAAGLRDEMKTLGKGIHVSVVEPGPFKTGFNQKLSDSGIAWMEKGSIFTKEQVENVKSGTARTLALAEAGSTASVVGKIVAASEAKKPRLRYVAPLHFAILVQIMRMFGV
ncbi:MAG: SDR family NAD(P)-dependent oxidoreductase [Pseudomonadota bacterium]